MMKREEKPTKAQEARLRNASENLEKIEEKIAPYVKERKVVSISTAGQWAKPPKQAAAHELTRQELFGKMSILGGPLEDQRG